MHLPGSLLSKFEINDFLMEMKDCSERMLARSDAPYFSFLFFTVTSFSGLCFVLLVRRLTLELVLWEGRQFLKFSGRHF